MCECGCGEFRPLVKLRVAGGWVGIELYPGCENCGTGWALGATFVRDGSEEAEYLLDGTPDMVFDERGQWGLPILDLDVLRRLFAEYAENGDDPDGEANYALSEFLSRGGLRQVYHETRYPSAPSPEERANG